MGGERGRERELRFSMDRGGKIVKGLGMGDVVNTFGNIGTIEGIFSRLVKISKHERVLLVES